MGVIKIKIRIKIRIIVKTRIVLKGGGNDHEWMGVTEWTPLGCLADFPRRGATR